VQLTLALEVAASPSQVWEVLSHVEGWPRWHPGIEFVALRGPAGETKVTGLEVGHRMNWRVDGFRIRSRVAQVDPGHLLELQSQMLGALGGQRWTLEPLEGGGSRIRLEEWWEGVLPFLLRWTLRRTLRVARIAWLDRLDLRLSRNNPGA